MKMLSGFIIWNIIMVAIAGYIAWQNQKNKLEKTVNWAIGMVGVTVIGDIVFALIWGRFKLPGWILAAGIIMTAIGVFVNNFYKTIPANPPSVGVQTVWGKRTGIVKPEGLVLSAPFFPLNLDYIVIEVTKRNKDLDAFEVWASETGDTGKMAVQMMVSASFTWSPNPEKINAFINAGKDTGVESIINDVINGIVRETGQGTPWEEFLGMKAEISKNILEKLNENHETNGLGISAETLGIIIHRLVIKEIQFADAEMKKATEARAREERERRAEVYEIETETNQAQSMIDFFKKNGKDLGPTEAYNLIKINKQIREGKIHSQQISLVGLEPFVELAKIFFEGRRK